MIDPLALFLTPAGSVFLISTVFALTTGIIMGILYLRRLRGERRAAMRDSQDQSVSRQLLRLLQRPDSTIDAPLAAVGVDQAIRVFSHLLQLVRGGDRDGLLNLADRLGLPDAAIAQLHDPRSSRRVDAMRVLEQLPIPRALTALRDRMAHDRDHQVRLEAACALARVGELPPPSCVIDMLGLRTGRVNRMHEAIFRACAVRHGDSLRTLSNDRSLGMVRPLLVEALGWSEDFSIQTALAVHAADSEPDIRTAALRAANRLSHPGVAAWVLPMLLDPVEHVRVQAAKTSGALGLREAIPVLMALVESPSWWVRMRAAQALAILRPAQPAPFGRARVRT